MVTVPHRYSIKYQVSYTIVYAKITIACLILRATATSLFKVAWNNLSGQQKLSFTGIVKDMVGSVDGCL